MTAARLTSPLASHIEAPHAPAGCKEGVKGRGGHGERGVLAAKVVVQAILEGVTAGGALGDGRRAVPLWCWTEEAAG